MTYLDRSLILGGVKPAYSVDAWQRDFARAFAPNVPTPQRPACGDNLKECDHETSARTEDSVIPGRRPESSNDGLTQQATNSTCVTARRDGHTTTRHSSGFGLGDSTRVECSCGWRGPERHEYQGNKCQLLAADERAHLAAATVQGDGA